MSKPHISVLMPVYNAAACVHAAIDSILSQSYADFEFIIINDGSTDDSRQIIQSFKDKRIRLIDNPHNLDLVETLNRGLELAQGEYIARMDADDIAYPKRLKTQLDFMHARSKLGICGSFCRTFGERAGKLWRYPTQPDWVKAYLLFGSGLAHPSVMMRRSLLEQHGLKYEQFPGAEDYALWVRASYCFELDNVPEVLLKYRAYQASYTNAMHHEARVTSRKRIYAIMLEKLGLAADAGQVDQHYAVATRLSRFDLPALRLAERWLMTLKQYNVTQGVYSQEALDSLLQDVFYKLVCKPYNLGLPKYHLYRASPLHRPGIASRTAILCNALFKRRFGSKYA